MGWRIQVLGMKDLGIRNEGFGYQGWKVWVPGTGWRIWVPEVEDADPAQRKHLRSRPPA